MSIQLSFSLRVSSGVKTVHLLGSWDNYVGQLPLSRDKSSKSSWKGTFRFQNATLEAGQRYWYYYIVDGYHAAHNPSVGSVVEPTTGRELNILDVPSGISSSSSSREKSSRHRASLAVDIPKGRPLSVSQIKAPKPVSPHATKAILQADYSSQDLEELAARFGSTGLRDADEDDIVTNFSSSPTGSALSYASDSSGDSGRSGYSTPTSECGCVCERYGITRRGERVRLDCGGARCGYGESESDSCSDDDGYQARSTRRHGVIVG